MFEQDPPLLCRNAIPEGKGIMFSCRLSTRLALSPGPAGRRRAQPGQRRVRAGAGVAPCSDRPVAHLPALLGTRVARATSPPPATRH